MEIANIVQLRAGTGQAGALGQVLHDLLSETRKEAGCTTCTLHRSADDADLFMVYERWRDQHALDAHMGTPHVAHFLARADALLAEPPEVRPFDPIF